MTVDLTGYEGHEISRIEEILDAEPASSTQVYRDTQGFSERAIAAVAAKRAGSGGGSQTLAEVLVAGADPDGNAITGAVKIDSHDATDSALWIRAEDDAQAVVIQVDKATIGIIYGLNQAGEMSLYPNAAAGSGFVVDVVSGGPANGLLQVRLDGNPVFSVTSGGQIFTTGGLYSYIITSGTLPTVSPSSGTPFQCGDGSRDTNLVVPFTLTNAAGTVAVDISPDNSTFTTLVTLAPGVNASVGSVNVAVPAGWYVKLTASQATLGTGHYY